MCDVCLQAKERGTEAIQESEEEAPGQSERATRRLSS